jgi:hypothetical protein
LWIAADPIDHTMINLLCRLTRHDPEAKQLGRLGESKASRIGRFPPKRIGARIAGNVSQRPLPNGERIMANTAIDETPISTDEDDFLAAFIAIVRENELREREQTSQRS